MLHTNKELCDLVMSQTEVTDEFLAHFKPSLLADHLPGSGINLTFFAIETAIKFGDYRLVAELTEHFLSSDSGPELKEAMRESLKMQVAGRPIYLLACVCSSESAAAFYAEKYPEYTESESHAPLLAAWKMIVEYLVNRLDINLSDMPTKHPKLLHADAIDYITSVRTATLNKPGHQNPEQAKKFTEMLEFVAELKSKQKNTSKPKPSF